MSLLDKIKNNSTIKNSAILSISKFFTQKDMIPTSIPMINVALSGKLNGGFTPGITMFAGPSKHFKTAFSLLMAKSYLEKYPDSVIIFMILNLEHHNLILILLILIQIEFCILL